MSKIDPTPIHLLYVPTLQCNLGCRYCYLGHETDVKQAERKTGREILGTLKEAVEMFRNANYLPFNISLHGGEVTTLTAESLELLFDFITRYYQENSNQLKELGFTKSTPHVKTNLLNFHSLIPLFERYKVSVSASIDLPLSLHKEYRTTKKGSSSLEQIVKNLKLLASYPYNSKISTTIFQPHFLKKEELAHDIETIHREYGFDMNHFNIMFGFESAKNRQKFQPEGITELRMMTEEEQVEIFHFLTERFTGTELEPGLKSAWFDEFTPSYCTNCFNCGEKFFLLQADGSIYSCVRGQGTEEFKYGNIFQDNIEEIADSGRKKISFSHKNQGFHPDCQQCEYLNICHTGCPFVKAQMESGKSYTCKLQKELYRETPDEYPAANDEELKKGVLEYASDMHPNEVMSLLEKYNDEPEIILPGDFYQEGNSLKNIIDKDSILKELYRSDIFLITLDEQEISLQSQLLKPSREIYSVNPNQQLTLHVRKDIFQVNCPDRFQNSLHLQMLRNTKVVYGDEQRTKQEHIFTHQVYWSVLTCKSTIDPDFLALELTGLLKCHASFFMSGVLNNLFITTTALREYHYKKHKSNGFYHIQALNLPFQNFEFFWG